MNIAVLVRHVPETGGVRLRAGEEFSPCGLPQRMNVFDDYALELAAELKDEMPKANVIAVSVGGEAARRALVEALSVAADKAYLVSDDAFRGADSRQTALILSAALARIGTLEGDMDLILCGRQTSSGGTTMIGYMLAELTGFDLVTDSFALRLNEAKAGAPIGVTAQKRIKSGAEEVSRYLPAVITVTKLSHDVRLAAFSRIRQANRLDIPVFDFNDLRDFGLAPDCIGASSYATEIVRVIKPGRKSKNSIVRASDSDDVSAARALLAMLEEDKILK